MTSGPAPERLSAALADRYLIERELGQGGMATVYLARDRKLGRDVALKVLRPELAAALGTERFLREIEIAARLAHPHILALFDCGEAAGLLYYTMPFVEGESLRDRLGREKQLPLEDALRITREVADALGYAHALGLVHRDIKPENILFAAGHAVLSDFGIARAVSAAGGARLTETGLAVGTPAYMSPEQAAGSQDVDGRSDLYSLGCVLYEMLSGETPYTGPTPQAILAQKLSEPLPRISVVREAVPAGIEAAINKALARTPADRWRTAAELLAHLEPVAMSSEGTAPVRPRRAPGRLPRWVPLVGGLVALAAIALAVSQLVLPKPLSITASDIRQVTSEPGVEYQPALSPDGNDVAYVAGPFGRGRLFVRSAVNVAGGATVRLGDTALGSEQLPAWSPDGQLVRYWGCPGTGSSYATTTCGVKETGKLGGAVRPLTLPPGARHSAWSPDGVRVAFVRADTIFTATAAGAGVRRVAIHKEVAFWPLHSLAWSPDGKRIAYVSGNPAWILSGNVAASSIWIVNAEGGVPLQIAGDGFLNASPAWLDARHLLFVSDRDGPPGVYVVEVGPRGRRGAPRAITGVADVHSISFSIGARRLAFSRLILRQNIWAYPLGRPTPTSIRDGRPVTSGTQVIETHGVSPDGRWIAYSGNLGGHMDLYKIPAGGGQSMPLTSGGAGGEAPDWSPDGREIAFHAGPGTNTQVMVMPAEGGSPVALTSGAWPLWSPSGLEISFNRPSGLWLLSRDSVGGAWREAVPFPHCRDGDVIWAPDGSGALCTVGSSMVVYSHDGRVVWRRDLAATSRLKRSFGFAYSRDSRTIYDFALHEDGTGGVWAIPVAGGAPRLVVAFDDPALVASQLTVGPDHLYLTVSQDESDIWVANLRW